MWTTLALRLCTESFHVKLDLDVHRVMHSSGKSRRVGIDPGRQNHLRQQPHPLIPTGGMRLNAYYLPRSNQLNVVDHSEVASRRGTSVPAPHRRIGPPHCPQRFHVERWGGSDTQTRNSRKPPQGPTRRLTPQTPPRVRDPPQIETASEPPRLRRQS